jgi:hypothetical protein
MNYKRKKSVHLFQIVRSLNSSVYLSIFYFRHGIRTIMYLYKRLLFFSHAFEFFHFAQCCRLTYFFFCFFLMFLCMKKKGFRSDYIKFSSSKPWTTQGESNCTPYFTGMSISSYCCPCSK